MSTNPAAVRIGFCITELDPGGAEWCLAELVARLDRQQFEPVVYCLGPRPAGNPAGPAERVERSGAKVTCFGARHAVQFPWIVRAVARRMRADGPQIVQGFLFHGNTVGALAARRAGVPHMLTGIRVAERRATWHLGAARWTDRWVERHVCVSEAVREFSQERTGLPSGKLVVIPNGVDLARFDAAQPCSLATLGVRPGRRVIAYVGRLDKQKGLEWLLRLMPRVLSDVPTHDLVIVGDGPRRRALERTTAELGLGDKVHFAGFRDDVPQILAASDLLVLPSRWEGMPNVVLEAMAAGKPVVATDVEGVGELLGPASAQQVVRIDHHEAFVAKVRAVLQNRELAGDLGRQNRQRAAGQFSIDAMVQAYERLYRSLVFPQI